MTTTQEYLSKQQEEYINQLQMQLNQEQLNRMNIQNQYGELSAFSGKKNDNLIEYQLDLKEELDRIFHLLSGHILKLDSNENEIWSEPDDDRLIIFSEYGVKELMKVIQFYINRNTILSYFDEDTIKRKIRDFGIELADLVFNKYEVFFHYPSPEDLFEIYKKTIEEHNLNISETELYWKCVKWSNEELQSKVRHFPMIILSLVDSVHSTYLRAYKGETLKAMRTTTHISQNVNANGMTQQPQEQKSFSFMKPSTWGKK